MGRMEYVFLRAWAAAKIYIATPCHSWKLKQYNAGEAKIGSRVMPLATPNIVASARQDRNSGKGI